MIYEGSDLKFAIDIKCDGFSMERDDFTIELRNGRKKVTVSKEDMPYNSEEDTWYLCFNSKALGAGDIVIVVYAHVPDDDFEDNERTEVYSGMLCHIEGIE